MAKYKITMTKNGASDTVVVYREKEDVKAMYDEATAGATYIFGSSGPDRPHVV